MTSQAIRQEFISILAILPPDSNRKGMTEYGNYPQKELEYGENYFSIPEVILRR
jgi:hypothetical protein